MYVNPNDIASYITRTTNIKINPGNAQNTETPKASASNNRSYTDSVVISQEALDASRLAIGNGDDGDSSTSGKKGSPRREFVGPGMEIFRDIYRATGNIEKAISVEDLKKYLDSKTGDENFEQIASYVDTLIKAAGEDGQLKITEAKTALKEVFRNTQDA